MQVPNISVPQATEQFAPLQPAQPKPSTSFQDLLGDAIHDIDQQQRAVDTQIERVVRGETTNLHEVSLAAANADISFRFLLEVRDQVIAAYREVMRMQV